MNQQEAQKILSTKPNKQLKGCEIKYSISKNRWYCIAKTKKTTNMYKWTGYSWDITQAHVAIKGSVPIKYIEEQATPVNIGSFQPVDKQFCEVFLGNSWWKTQYITELDGKHIVMIDGHSVRSVASGALFRKHDQRTDIKKLEDSLKDYTRKIGSYTAFCNAFVSSVIRGDFPFLKFTGGTSNDSVIDATHSATNKTNELKG